MADSTTLNLMTTDANEPYKYCVYLYPENGGTLTMSCGSAEFELTEIEKGSYCLKNKYALYASNYSVALTADCGGSGTFTCQLTLSLHTGLSVP
jgi:hypothetical protein